MVEQDYMDNGIPCSLSFDLILQETVDFENLQEQLYAADIHILDDVLANRRKVNDILRKNLNAETIIRSIKD